MTKFDIIKEIARKSPYLTRDDVSEVVDGFLTAISRCLERGEHVALYGFGSFDVKTNEGRECRHPVTGEKVVYGAYKAVKFLPSTSLKNAIKK